MLFLALLYRVWLLVYATESSYPHFPYNLTLSTFHLRNIIIFEGRIPYVGSADSKHWLETLTKLETDGLNVLIPGHGPASTHPQNTIKLTRKYLAYLRDKMGAAVEEFTPFDEVYSATNWSEFATLPAFKEGNRKNAYQVYLSMEAEFLQEE